MRQHIVTQAIVLSRTDFQEADRILTVLTPDHGKLRVIAKGVRRPKSKLAGGIELFSINDLTILPGRSEIQTLVSSRLVTHYADIVKDIQRTMLGYELIKKINRVTEDAAEAEYFELLQQVFVGLNDAELSKEMLELWFSMQLLNQAGHMPNLKTDTEGKALSVNEKYLFDFDEMSFRQQKGGPYGANHIKLLRLGHGIDDILVMKQVTETSKFASPVLLLAQNMLKQNIRH